MEGLLSCQPSAPAMGLKLRRHLEAAAFIVAPPARESRQFLIPRVTFVDEASGDATGPAVEIFVAAPDREIQAPIVKLELQISGGVRHVETDDAALGVRGFGDA